MMKSFLRKWSAFVLLMFSSLARGAVPDPGGTNGLLASFYFNDTNTWVNDFGYSPVSFTNLSSLQLNSINCLVMDSTNSSRLQFNVVEGDSHTNLMVTQGTILMWYSPNWVGTNEGGTGPGQFGRLIEVGTSSSAWWSFCFDPSGNILFCGKTNGGSQVTYLTTPVSWTTNNDGWSYLSLTYSSTNSALYLNGVLVTNANGVSAIPDTNTLNKGFFIGSDTNGTTQAKGLFSDIEIYDHPLTADEIAGYYVLYSLLRSPSEWISITSGIPTNSITPFNAITGAGNLITGGTNSAACVISTNIWFTNVVGKAVTNGTELKFVVGGGADGVVYDVFANSVPAPASDTNRPWSWMGQAYHCVTNTLTITNQPNVSAFLLLGKPIDTDSDGLTDAYELLVSKTDPTIPDSNGDGIPDTWIVLNGLNPQTPGIANEDLDFDALTNKQEYLFGTKPLVPEGFWIWLSTPIGFNGIP